MTWHQIGEQNQNRSAIKQVYSRSAFSFFAIFTLQRSYLKVGAKEFVIYAAASHQAAVDMFHPNLLETVPLLFYGGGLRA